MPVFEKRPSSVLGGCFLSRINVTLKERSNATEGSLLASRRCFVANYAPQHDIEQSFPQRIARKEHKALFFCPYRQEPETLVVFIGKFILH